MCRKFNATAWIKKVLVILSTIPMMTMTAKMNLMMMMISRITARSLKDEFKDYEYDIKDNSSLPHLQYGVVPKAVPEHLLEEADHGPEEGVGQWSPLCH